MSDGALTRRFDQKARAALEPWKASRLTRDDIRALQRAFVEALKEEVEARYAPATIAQDVGPCLRPLVIAGLGSFKMRTRPAMAFADPSKAVGSVIEKDAARRLVFTSKWEPIDG